MPGSKMSPDVKVWISTARNGISYHAIAHDGRRTVCGRYIGTDVQRGYVFPLAQVVDEFGSRPCRLCTGDMERVSPSVRPSRDTPW